MTSLRDRQRAAARARLAQEMALRQEAARRRRQRTTIISSSVAAVVVIGLVVWIAVAVSGGKKHTPSAAASASSTPANCAWNPNPDPSASSTTANPYLKNTGTPPTTGEPRSGTRDMTIDSNVGTIVIQLDLAKAPCTSESFTYLASKKYFDNSGCHRLLNSSGTNSDTGAANEAHLLQCGDPSGTGQGGPSYTFFDENLPTNQRPTYPAGTVAMANSGTNTNGSQFFIVYADTTLPANYTIFGKVTTGLDIIKNVAAAGDDGAFAANGGPGGGHPKTKITFKTVTVGPVVGGSAAPSSTTPSTQPTPSQS